MRRRDRLRYLRELNLSAPPGMVTAATERRLAGDWRGACAAALVDAPIDLRSVRSRYGRAHAERVEAELTGLAPDLMRRFLPRTQGWLVPGATVVLSRHDEPCRRGLAGGWRDLPVLVATLPRSWQVPQSITLEVRHELPGSFYDLPAWAWHADAVADRRWAYGAGRQRLAWHFADGSPYPAGTTTAPQDAIDRAGEFERIVGLLSARRPVKAFEAAGFTVERHGGPHDPGTELTRLPFWMKRALPVARAEMLRLARRYEQRSFATPSRLIGVNGLTVHPMSGRRPGSGPRLFGIAAPMEVALLGLGGLTADDLHPLVHDALFPGRHQRRAPVRHVPESIRVRCGTQWHTVVATGGHLRTPHHDEAEIRRELRWESLGATASGCAAAVRGWRTGGRPIAKDVRKDRHALFALAQHGDTDGLLARLANGLDPGLRGPGGGTLLHWLAHLDHEVVLPVLLGAGLSLEERDHAGRTALHAAAECGAEATMAALIAAGADPEARDHAGQTPGQVLHRRAGHSWL